MIPNCQRNCARLNDCDTSCTHPPSPLRDKHGFPDAIGVPTGYVPRVEAVTIGNVTPVSVTTYPSGQTLRSDDRAFTDFIAMLKKPSPIATAGIGDITSTAKGSGARYNAGKPALDLIPLRLLSHYYTQHDGPAGSALRWIGRFQEGGDATHLMNALDALGDGWDECAAVFQYGLDKYAPWNWAKGMPWSVPIACAARHLVKMAKGMTVDEESGKPHRGHVYANVVMLMTYIETYPEGDDRPAPGLISIAAPPKPIAPPPAAAKLKLESAVL